MLKSLLHENVQRVGPLAFVPGLLTRFAVDPMQVIAAAGLSAQSLANPDASIPYAASARLLGLCAEKTQCPHFGLEIGKKVGTTALGLVGQMMRNASTLGAAILDRASHHHHDAHGSVIYVLLDKWYAFFGYAVYQPNVPGHDWICDLTAMAGFNLVSELVGADYKHRMEVLFSRSRPRDLSPNDEAFGVKLRFNAEQTAIMLPRALLEHPVIGANATVRKVLQQRVAEIWHAGPLDIMTRLRRELRVALISNQVSAHAISARMGMSRRTLHRRLDAYNVKFQDILDETRCEFVEQLLANTRLGIGEVGRIVGYSDPSILTRAFIRWRGVSPKQWRSHMDTLPLTVTP